MEKLKPGELRFVLVALDNEIERLEDAENVLSGTIESSLARLRREQLQDIRVRLNRAGERKDKRIAIV